MNTALNNRANLKNNLRYIFFGTPEFAAHILRRLIEATMAPRAVVCALDKPTGRKQIVTPPPVKIIAETHDIPVLQPETVRSDDFNAAVRSYKPDLLVIVAYGKILPKNLLSIGPKGAVNLHPSLLPRWRGPAPIQYAILSGDEETGVSIMLLDEAMDHGPLLAQEAFPIEARDTAATLGKRLADHGAALLIAALPRLISGTITPKPQDHARATYSHIIKKEAGGIDWSDRAENIERKIRAFTPWPGTHAWYSVIGTAHRLKILSGTPLASRNPNLPPPGTLIMYNTDIPAVVCIDGLLILKEVQPEGGNPMTGAEFIRGHSNVVNSQLFKP